MEPTPREILKLGQLGLLDGERLVTVLGLGGGGEEVEQGEDVLVLTSTRLALMKRGGRQRKSCFASVQDIESIEVAEVRRGFAGYLWAGLALLVAVLLWFTIDNTVGSAASAAVAGAMGAFLLYDRVSQPGATRVMVNTGRSSLVCELRGEKIDGEVQTFVNRLFEIKDGSRRRWTLR